MVSKNNIIYKQYVQHLFYDLFTALVIGLTNKS